MRRGAALPLAALCFACDVDFPDAYRVEDLRVLELSADPPEVPLFAPPPPGAELSFDPERLPPLDPTRVRLSALIVGPDLDARFGATFFRCDPTFERVPCDADEVPAELGTGPEVEVSIAETLATALLEADSPEALGLALAEDPRDIFNGFFAYMNLSARLEAGGPVDTPELFATKRVVVFEPRVAAAAVRAAAERSPDEVPAVAGLEVPTLCVGVSSAQRDEVLGFFETRRPNRAPTLADVELDRITFAGTATRSVAAGEVLELEPGERIALRARSAPGSEEDYAVVDGDCQIQRFTETLSYAWFTVRGSLSRHITTEESAYLRYIAPRRDQLDAEQVRDRIWVVMRDGRGGSDHAAFDVVVRR